MGLVHPLPELAACPERATWLTLLLDGELVDDDDAMNMRAHVATCPGCRASWDSQRNLQQLLRGAARTAAPTLPATLEARLEALLA